MSYKMSEIFLRVGSSVNLLMMAQMIVAKELALKESAKYNEDDPENQWNLTHLWYDRRQRIPMETKIHEVLHKRNSKYIVEYLGSCVYRERGAFRSYQEFCPGGDLGQVLKKYMVKQQLIPEPFLWYLFVALAEACHIMERITPQEWDDPDNGNLSTETDILHLDLKPGNGEWT